MEQPIALQNTQVHCPHCGSENVRRSLLAADSTAENGKNPPPSVVKALFIWVPVGVFSLFMLLTFGMGSGFGLWILGITLGIANPLYAIRQQRKLRDGADIYLYVCQQCQHTWKRQIH